MKIVRDSLSSTRLIKQYINCRQDRIYQPKILIPRALARTELRFSGERGTSLELELLLSCVVFSEGQDNAYPPHAQTFFFLTR